MKKITARFAEQLGDLVHRQIWVIAKSMGVEENAETIAAIDRHYIRGVDHEFEQIEGAETDLEYSDAEITEFAGMSDPVRSVGFSLASHHLGVRFLEDGELDIAVDCFFGALVGIAHSAGVIGDAPRRTLEVAEAIRQRKRDAAIAGHRATYKKREEIRAYWLANINRTLSNNDAAELLYDKFGSPDHRTLAGYVSKFKKDLLVSA